MKLWLIGFAASACLAPMAAAQTVADPDTAYGLSQIQLRLPAASAAVAAPAPAPLRAAPVASAAAEAAMVQPPMMHPAPSPGHRVEVRREMRRPMGHGPMPHPQMRREMHSGMGHHGPGRSFTRIRRGGFVPGFWTGPQFMVRNWSLHGFPQPFAGGRWIRYYDDALLIDRSGRVHDGRYGWDWDRHGDRWGYRDGIPVYVGDGDYEPEERDYEWAESWDERGPDRVYGHGGPPPPHCRAPCSRPYPGPPPHPGYGYGYGYGYGGCGCGPVVVTETITTTAPVVESRTYYEYVTEYAKPRKTYRKPVRRVKARPAPPRPAPPRPGERG